MSIFKWHLLVVAIVLVTRSGFAQITCVVAGPQATCHDDGECNACTIGTMDCGSGPISYTNGGVLQVKLTCGTVVKASSDGSCEDVADNESQYASTIVYGTPHCVNGWLIQPFATVQIWYTCIGDEPGSPDCTPSGSCPIYIASAANKSGL
jgi:hypothetical protein